MFGGDQYEVGELVPVEPEDACRECRCDDQTEIKCNVYKCPALQDPECKPGPVMPHQCCHLVECDGLLVLQTPELVETTVYNQIKYT